MAIRTALFLFSLVVLGSTAHPTDNKQAQPPPGAQGIPGGVGEERKVDPNVADLIRAIDQNEHAIKSAAAQALQAPGGKSDSNKFVNSNIQLLSYKTQTVAGTNYFVKFEIDDNIFHARIHKPLSGNAELKKVIAKDKKDGIAYFD